MTIEDALGNRTGAGAPMALKRAVTFCATSPSNWKTEQVMEQDLWTVRWFISAGRSFVEGPHTI